jgi:branched-chain amino acid transport system substrate-binding protein
MQFHKWFVRCLVVLLLVGISGVLVPAFAEELVIGGTCDRTGPTKNVGTSLCPGIHDYVKLVNKKGGIKGHTIRFDEVEHAYKVDRGVEAYERLKRAGALALADYGTPIVYALTPRHLEDKILGITPGFGRADSTDLLVPDGGGDAVCQGQRGQEGVQDRLSVLRQPGRA